jgi:hypothetical protein
MEQNSKWGSLLLVLTLLLAWVDVGACSRSGVKVVVSNHGPKSITNLQIAFTGGTESLQSLAAGTTHEFTINPTGESGIDLSFTASDGVVQNTKLDVYLGRNYEGRLEVQVAPPRPRSFGIF